MLEIFGRKDCKDQPDYTRTGLTTTFYLRGEASISVADRPMCHNAKDATLISRMQCMTVSEYLNDRFVAWRNVLTLGNNYSIHSSEGCILLLGFCATVLRTVRY